MDERSPRHFLRAWREASGFTLENVAERVGIIGSERLDAANDPLSSPRKFTHASLSRIERGLQPYNQPLLEILAGIYGTEPASLLIRDPSDPDGLWSLWDRLPKSGRDTALVVLQGMVAQAERQRASGE